MIVYSIRLTLILPSVILNFKSCSSIVCPKTMQDIHTVTVNLFICTNTERTMGDCTTTDL